MPGSKAPVREPTPTPGSPPKITTACPPSPFAPLETYSSLTPHFKNIQHRPRPKPVLSPPSTQLTRHSPHQPSLPSQYNTRSYVKATTWPNGSL
ncbi:hypothetical protein AAHC03_01090 [Spirometra sp. Aus1]